MLEFALALNSAITIEHVFKNRFISVKRILP